MSAHDCEATTLEGEGRVGRVQGKVFAARQKGKIKRPADINHQNHYHQDVFELPNLKMISYLNDKHNSRFVH